MTEGEISRRAFLGAAAAVGGAAVAITVLPAGAAQAAAAAPTAPAVPGPWRESRSANGWPVLAQAPRHGIEGSGQTVALAGGDAAVILTYVARRFHYEIDRLRTGDVQGHTTSTRVEEAYESNYLSGSALAIRPQAYPIGARGGLYPRELVVVRDILAELDGVVAWGGDLDPPKESHFEIAYGPGDSRVKDAARAIAAPADSPGRPGPGAIDAFDPSRRTKAQAFTARTG